MFQNNTNTNDVKVLFIAGSGRSGSTLLDMLLGQIDGLYSTGELRFIWSRGFNENQLCGCGKPFRECEFWTEVIREAFGRFENVDHARLEALRTHTKHRMSNGSPISSEQLTPYKDYFEACQKLYQAIHKISGCDFIVDSSKNTDHGFVLANIHQIDLFTAHLIRDSRAVAYSWRRQKIRPEVYWEQKFMGKRKLLTSATRWNYLQKSSEKLQKTSKAYTLLRYEDLVKVPKQSLQGLFAGLGIELPSMDFLDGLHANLRTSHTISGNPVRFTNKEIKIKADNEWQQAMPTHHKWLVTLITWPLLRKYGYFKNEEPNEKREAPILVKGS